MNNRNFDKPIAPIIDTSGACNKDGPTSNILVKDKALKSSAKKNSVDKSDNKRKKNIPQNIYIITSDETKSREVVAKAMADMYRRMLDPV